VLGDSVDATLVAARGGLLDALDALGPHAEQVVLVGAQAVYVHTPGVITGVALFTKDADVMLIPPVAMAPDIEGAMRAGGFTPGPQPGIWISGDGDREVDLLVPGVFTANPSHRAARLAGHGPRTARLVSGIEGAIVDNAVHLVPAFATDDQRTARIKVAGPAALLVAKAFKLTDRLGDSRPERLSIKDAFDAFRLLQLPLDDLLEGFNRMGLSDVARPVAARGVGLIDELFRNPDGAGATLAGEYLGPLGEPEIVRLSISETARDLLAALESAGWARA
jgi:hypothetical protein